MINIALSYRYMQQSSPPPSFHIGRLQIGESVVFNSTMSTVRPSHHLQRTQHNPSRDNDNGQA